MIEAMLQGGGSLVVAKRRETQRILAERDLNLAGLVDGPTAARAGKLLAVQGLITSKITIRVDVQKGRKATIDWGSRMGGMMRSMQETRDVRRSEPVVYREVRPARDPRYWRNPHYVRDPRYVYVPRPRPGPVHREETTAAGGGLSLKTKDVEEISRHLTVQCSFALMDAVTGRVIAQYSPPPYQKRDKASPHFLFGSSMSIMRNLKSYMIRQWIRKKKLFPINSKHFQFRKMQSYMLVRIPKTMMNSLSVSASRTITGSICEAGVAHTAF